MVFQFYQLHLHIMLFSKRAIIAARDATGYHVIGGGVY